MKLTEIPVYLPLFNSKKLSVSPPTLFSSFLDANSTQKTSITVLSSRTRPNVAMPNTAKTGYELRQHGKHWILSRETEHFAVDDNFVHILQKYPNLKEVPLVWTKTWRIDSWEVGDCECVAEGFLPLALVEEWANLPFRQADMSTREHIAVAQPYFLDIYRPADSTRYYMSSYDDDELAWLIIHLPFQQLDGTYVNIIQLQSDDTGGWTLYENTKSNFSDTSSVFRLPAISLGPDIDTVLNHSWQHFDRAGIAASYDGGYPIPEAAGIRAFTNHLDNLQLAGFQIGRANIQLENSPKFKNFRVSQCYESTQPQFLESIKQLNWDTFTIGDPSSITPQHCLMEHVNVPHAVEASNNLMEHLRFLLSWEGLRLQDTPKHLIKLPNDFVAANPEYRIHPNNIAEISCSIFSTETGPVLLALIWNSRTILMDEGLGWFSEVSARPLVYAIQRATLEESYQDLCNKLQNSRLVKLTEINMLRGQEFTVSSAALKFTTAKVPNELRYLFQA